MKQEIYFGTYTKKLSEGIYHATLDSVTNSISHPKNIISIGNPTYLRSLNNNMLLSIATNKNQGGIALYSSYNNQFTLLDSSLSEGSSPCYLGYDSQRNLVFAAYYHRGTVEAYHIDKNGHLTLTDSIKQSGAGPREEQKSSHIHYADLTPDNRLAVIDLGSDTLTTYDISNEGKLTFKNQLKLPAGFGPRHLVFAPNNNYAYLIGELSSQIATLKYHKSEGRFEIISSISTIPSTLFNKHNGASAIRITSNGKYLYAANRGHDSIVSYQILNDHTLDLIEYTNTQGSFPRDFALDSTEKFLIVANQNTNNISLFTVNQQNGKLNCIQHDIVLPEGVCVCFKN